MKRLLIFFLLITTISYSQSTAELDRKGGLQNIKLGNNIPPNFVQLNSDNEWWFCNKNFKIKGTQCLACVRTVKENGVKVIDEITINSYDRSIHEEIEKNYTAMYGKPSFRDEAIGIINCYWKGENVELFYKYCYDNTGCSAIITFKRLNTKTTPPKSKNIKGDL